MPPLLAVQAATPVCEAMACTLDTLTMAPPPASHLGNGMPGRQVYPLEVDVEDFVPDVLLGLRDRPVALDPGAVDEHVNPSIGLDGEVDESFHVRRGGHVSPHPPDFQALFTQPAGRPPA